MTFSERLEWTFQLPPLTSWARIFPWLDRWEKTVYRVDGHQIRMWLPKHVGNGFMSISPDANDRLVLVLHHDGTCSQGLVEQFLRHWWDLDRDMQPFYDRFGRDPILADSIHRNKGARIVGFPDVFEALVIGILGQQVNVQFAYTLKERLTEAFGESMDWEGGTWWRFPKPESILNSSVTELRDMQISSRKAEYILGVAQAMVDGMLSQEILSRLPFAEQMALLTSLRGIGNWTAQYVCMKNLHGMEAFPAGDAGLQNAIKSILKMDRKPTIDELYELAASWKGWEAYATWFLWMS